MNSLHIEKYPEQIQEVVLALQVQFTPEQIQAMTPEMFDKFMKQWCVNQISIYNDTKEQAEVVGVKNLVGLPGIAEEYTEEDNNWFEDRYRNN